MGFTIQSWNLGRDERFFCSLECPDRLWGQPTLLFSGYRGFFLRVNWLGLEDDNLSQHSAKAKNEWTCTSTPPTIMVWTETTLLIHVIYMKDSWEFHDKFCEYVSLSEKLLFMVDAITFC